MKIRRYILMVCVCILSSCTDNRKPTAEDLELIRYIYLDADDHLFVRAIDKEFAINITKEFNYYNSNDTMYVYISTITKENIKYISISSNGDILPFYIRLPLDSTINYINIQKTKTTCVDSIDKVYSEDYSNM